MEENHYYPFGLKHRAYNIESYMYAMPMDGSPGYNIPELVDETVDNPNPYKYKSALTQVIKLREKQQPKQ
ncbi:hypothetical protein E6C50_08255 [Flavobacterium supellecticarium]|uniref:Uncharacterized protein n=1 Tax=Flavobacterium supellecticarium TaxID=2565924 RepID=A0A4S4A0Q5_9FLAO|nr:hypothetical protein [Flavobacterium supellecticarium]THF51742.1 hypothetical protein E6C50_08255 [Flavobacterium supellecticarium]